LSTVYQTVLLHSLKGEPQSEASRASHVLHAFTLAGIVFNLGSTLGSIFTLVLLSDFTGTARNVALYDADSLPARVLRGIKLDRSLLGGRAETELLREFGMSAIWNFARSQMLLTFLAGSLCSFVSFGLWGWHFEDRVVSIAVMIPFALVSVPSALVFLAIVQR
jgi:hypothetical protein